MIDYRPCPWFPFEAAFDAAKAVAANHNARLGQVTSAFHGDGPDNPCWCMVFELVDGPPNWHWQIWVDLHKSPLITAIRTEPRHTGWFYDFVLRDCKKW